MGTLYRHMVRPLMFYFSGGRFLYLILYFGVAKSSLQEYLICNELGLLSITGGFRSEFFWLNSRSGIFSAWNVFVRLIYFLFVHLFLNRVHY